MSNDAIEAEIIKRLPTSYAALCLAIGHEHDRKIDAALQRLRKRKLIAYVRKGNITTWSLSKST